MKIIFSKYHTGKEIVKALSSISKYKTKILTKVEVFDEKLGIIPGKVKIQMTSLSPTIYLRDLKYPTLITVDDIVLIGRHYSVDMQVNYFRNDGTILNVTILTDNDGNKTHLTKNIEAVIRQFLKNLG